MLELLFFIIVKYKSHSRINQGETFIHLSIFVWGVWVHRSIHYLVLHLLLGLLSFFLNVILTFLFFSFRLRAAIAVLGCMYEKLGRMMGSSYPETIQNLIKALKNAEVRDKSFLSSHQCSVSIRFCFQMSAYNMMSITTALTLMSGFLAFFTKHY